eukprot:966015-Prymnesium_polylepis.1
MHTVLQVALVHHRISARKRQSLSFGFTGCLQVEAAQVFDTKVAEADDDAHPRHQVHVKRVAAALPREVAPDERVAEGVAALLSLQGELRAHEGCDPLVDNLASDAADSRAQQTPLVGGGHVAVLRLAWQEAGLVEAAVALQDELQRRPPID